MNFSVKPQPVIGELLPGFTALSILIAAYLHNNGAALAEAGQLAKSGPILAGGLTFLLLASWVLGTLFDAIRDIFEALLDYFGLEINWNYLADGDEARIQKIEDQWLHYYFLTGNFSIALLVCLILHFVPGSFVPLSTGYTTIISIALAIFILNTMTLRCELRRLMRCDDASVSGKPKPHSGVYTRLGVSHVADACVGVFAISDIPSGADVFGEDNAETVMVKKSETLSFSPEIRKLYHDFCVLKNGTYECPVNFNALTVSWYLNTSKTPNVRADSDLRFKAIRPIKAGDELFSDYDEYSENEDNEFTS
jgi:hypothetical protein